MIDSPTITLTETQQRALDNLPPRVAEALSHFRDNLLARFPDQIRRIILYGSFARGEAHEESDVDVMVVVGWEEERLPGGWYASPYGDPRWEEIIDMSVDATLECGHDVAAFVIGETLFQKSIHAAGEARREGIELYRSELASVTKTIGTQTYVDDEIQPASTRVLKERAETGDYDAEDSADLSNPRLWLSLADEKLQTARILINAGLYDDTISRAYYGMFYAAKAALVPVGVAVKSHAGALSQFAERFVATGRCDKRYSKMLSRARRERNRSDYEPAYRAKDKKAMAEGIVGDAESFIAKARELVEEELSKRGASPS